MKTAQRGRGYGIWCGHAARLAVVAAIAWLVHAEHAAFLRRSVSADVSEVPIAVIQAYLPGAADLGGESMAVAGGRDVVAADGARVGTILRTSPAGDAAIGFSGPTDLLVVCDADLRVAGVEILASRDTRDHVAAIKRDRSFLDSFRGRALADLAVASPAADAVAGSTLTCHAIGEAIALRLGGKAPRSRFTEAPALTDLRAAFPNAVRVEVDAGDPAVIRVYAGDDIPLGWALRTSPAADRVIGYQGPTDAAVCFDTEGKVAGIVVAASFDNEPFVGYVRDDGAFRRIWRGLSIEQLAGIDPVETGIEGVSGATMTSQAVAEGIVRAAHDHYAHRDRRDGLAAAVPALLRAVEPPQWGALGLIVTGIVTAFTRLRGTWFGRLALPIAVLAYLGFGAGALLSQAQLFGWAQAGVPRGAVVLAALTAAAILLPATTRKNVYCSHLCAHGAAQQLLVRFARPRQSLPARLRPLLVALPWTLLTLAILTAVLHLPIALVDVEPFDAYLPAVAGVAALVVFGVSLVVSGFVPMAYCRHACPTGALLDHVRLSGRSDRLSWRDGVLVGCLVIAAVAHWWPR
ncbi:MAG: FMN-binding protein [Planctomycetia bacterium]|nr:FMN-binding protein [Planctomycetia bacterium]